MIGSFDNEIDLMGQGLRELDVLTNLKRERCHSLNLHFNRLQNLHGLPRYIFLKEMNISSNQFVTADLPELALLPALTSLDLSGNKIETLTHLPFLPGLKHLAVAFNFVSNIESLAENAPNLESLDLRGNIIRTSFDLQALGAMSHLKELQLGGSQPNPICTVETETTPSDVATRMEKLFHLCPSLCLIDRKSHAEWAKSVVPDKWHSKHAPSLAAATGYLTSTGSGTPQTHDGRREPAPQALQQQVGGHGEEEFTAAGAAAVAQTPHFDRVAAKFRAHKDRQAALFSPPTTTATNTGTLTTDGFDTSSPEAYKCHHRYDGHDDGHDKEQEEWEEEEEEEEEEENLFEAGKENYPQPPQEASLLSSASSAILTPISDKTKKHQTPISNGRRAPEKGHTPKASVGNSVLENIGNNDGSSSSSSSSRAATSAITAVVSRAELETQLEIVREEESRKYRRYLRLQRVGQVIEEAQQKEIRYKVAAAFAQMKCFAWSRLHQQVVRKIELSHTQVKDLLAKEHQKTLHEVHREYETKLVTQQTHHDKLYSKQLQYEATIATLKSEQEIQHREKEELTIQVAQLQRTVEADQQTLARQQEDGEIKRQAQELHAIRLTEKHEIALKELEIALGESTGTIEKLRAELSYTRQRLVENDEHVIKANNNANKLQTEKDHLTQLLALKESELTSIIDTHQQSQNITNSTIDDMNQQLVAANQQISAYRAKEGLQEEVREKLESRLRKLQSAFEELSDAHAATRQENEQLQMRHEKDYKSIKDLSKCAKRLQEVVDMRKQRPEHQKELQRDQKQQQQQQEKLEKELQDTSQELAEVYANMHYLEEDHRRLLAQLHEKDEQVSRLEHSLNEQITALADLQQQQQQQHQQQQQEQQHGGDAMESGNDAANTADADAVTAEVELELHAMKAKCEELHSALRVKETMLDDKGAEVADWKEKFHEQSQDFRQCRRDYASLEQELEDTRDEVLHLEAELAKRSETEHELQRLIAEFQSTASVDATAGAALPASASTSSAYIGSDNAPTTAGATGTGSTAHSAAVLITSPVDGDLGTGLPPRSPRSAPILPATAAASATTTQTVDPSSASNTAIEGVCIRFDCQQARQQLVDQLNSAQEQYETQKKEYERLFRLKNEECANFAQALTNLEKNSVELGSNIKSEKERFEGVILKYKQEKRQLAKQCRKLEEALSTKETELVRTKAAAEQLQSAFANFQKLSV